MAINLGDAELQITGNPDQLEKSFKGVGKKIAAGMAIAGAAIVVSLGVATKKAAEFGKGIGNIATLGVPNLDELKEGIMEVSQAIGVDLGDAAQATYDIISAGVEPAKAIEFLGAAAIAAKAGIGELGDAVDLGTTVMNAFGLSTKDTGRIFDQTQAAIKLGKTNIAELGAAVGKVAPLLKGAGVASEEMFAALAQLTSGGLSTAESVTGLRAVIASILKPTGDAEKVAKKLGIEWNSQGLAAQGLSGLMAELAEKTGGNVDAIGALIPSVEAMPAALRLMADGGAQLSSKLDQVTNSTGESQAAFQRYVDANPGEKLDRLRAVVEVLAVKIGDVLVPVLGLFVDKVIPVLIKISEWITENPKLAAGIVLFAAALGALLLVLGSLMLIMPGLVATMGLFGAGAGAAGIATGGLTLAIGPLLVSLGLLGIAVVAGTALLVTLAKAFHETAMAELELEESDKALADQKIELIRRTGKTEEEINEKSNAIADEKFARVKADLELELGREATISEIRKRMTAEAVEEGEARKAAAIAARETSSVVVSALNKEATASTETTNKKIANSKRQIGAMQARLGAIGKNSGAFAAAAKVEIEAGAKLLSSKLESSEKEIAAGRTRIGEIVINGKKFVATISAERKAQIDAENIKVKSLKREIDAALVAAAKRKQIGQNTANAVRKTSSEIAKANEDAAVTVQEVWNKSSDDVQKAMLKMAGASAKGTDSIGKSWDEVSAEVKATTTKIVDSMMDTSPFATNSPSLVDQTKDGLSRMGEMWNSFASGLESLIAGLVDKMKQLSPLNRQSPSLVDQVKTGTKEMRKQWSAYDSFLQSLGGADMPMSAGLGASLGGVAGSSAVGSSVGAFSGAASALGNSSTTNSGGNTTILNFDMTGLSVRSDADITRLSQQIFRHVDRSMQRKGIQLGLATAG